jgi:hypothetical protein
MNEFWYYAEGIELRGPVTFETLLQTLLAHPSRKATLVWRDGFEDWMPADSVREIVEKLIQPPPLPSSGTPLASPRQKPVVLVEPAGEVDTSAEPSEPLDPIAAYQLQFRRKKKKWSLKHAALYGLLLSLFAFVVGNVADGGNDFMHWLRNGTFGMNVAYFSGQLLVGPVLFVLVAAIRNLFVRQHE